ncbi:hypothetical protein D5086_002212 [Populus alba]|uniref:Uncharacterized protein n=1 Tax=Populus alba TaxID=43335 RepID=A0ACC4D0V4_POPAL
MAHSQSRSGAIAPFDVKHEHGKRPGNPTTPTVKELLQGLAGLDPVEEGRATSSVVGPTKVALDQVTSDPSRDAVAAAFGYHFCTEEKKYDKIVSVKEYLMHNSGPEEDDRALSQVTS